MKKISAEKLLGDVNDKQTEEADVKVSVHEILLLNKSSGLPIFSRVYKKTSGKDPTLIAGLMAAIVQFGEMIGNNMELNDIGTREGTRIFVRSQKDLACLLTIGNFPLDSVTSMKSVEIVNELSSRIFETIHMMLSVPVYESNSPLDSVNIVVSDKTLDGPNMSIFPELGQIIDNVVLETTTQFYEYEEEEDIDLDAMVEKELFAMEETDSTYLKSEYSGTTQEIKKEKSTELRNFFSIFSRFTDTKR
ncbi:MAG: hypothetical protein JSW11_16425 [Candidatus Heimdallarchaeota archaeon]|nr:MAG: hypothetical protein JSW11_16425 [Candidatus Heimdallarchaeota archaeon]